MPKLKNIFPGFSSNRILKQNGPLLLLQTLQTISIVYRRNRKQDLILWQNETKPEESIQRYDRLENILKTISADLYRPKTFKLIQKLLYTMNDHPDWLEIHIAAYNGLEEYFNKITGEEINQQSIPELFTPLHLAVKQEFRLIIERILQFNPNVKLVDSENNSVLHLASNVDIFKLLLFNHNDMRSMLIMKNNQGLNPIELVCLNSRKEHLIQLMKFGLTARQLSIVPQNNQDFLSIIDNNQLVPFQDNDWSSMDFNRINSGGCPLHWSNKPELTKRLLDYFHKETPNLNGENPLMAMIQNDYFHSALLLVYSGSNVNQTDLNGNTALHMAVKRSNSLLVKALIIFDCDVNIQNSNGLNAFQLAQHEKPNNKSVIETFRSYHENRQKKNQFNEEHGFPKKEENDSKNSKTKKSRLICFDGGGIKGLFTVQMLIELQKYLRKDLIDYFDWFGGTSTGSMIAFALINKKTLFDVRRMYFNFKDDILSGNRPYNTKNLENFFKEQLGADILLKDVWNLYRKHLIITASRVDCHPPTLQLFCSHGCPTDDHIQNYPSEMSVWQVLRASCAAPTYFHDYRPYIDGGLISNNPTLDSITEFFRYHRKQKTDNQHKLDLVLSLGTGRTMSEQKNFSSIFHHLNYFMDFRSLIRDLNRSPWSFGNELVSQMKTQVTNCNDHIVNRATSWLSCLNSHYFRINATFTKKISLDESNDEELIIALWDVKLYCYKMEDCFKKIGQILDGQENY